MTDPQTIGELLRVQAARWQSKPMVIDPDSSVSYADLDRDTRTLAAGFLQAGVSKGTRVGLLMPNGVDWIRIWLSLARIGAVTVPLSTLLTARELGAQLRTASVQYLVAVEEFRGHRYHRDLTGLELPALRQVWTPAEVSALPTGPRGADVVDTASAAVTPADTVVIIFTSGSSGPPKGVVHSHGSALGAVRAGLAARCVRPDSRLYLPMPFFWVGGFGGGIVTALVAGATLVTEPAPDPGATLRLLARTGVTLFRGWPEQAAALARHPEREGSDLSALRPGSLVALLPETLRGRPGSRASLFGMTETFGPYCGYPADTDMPESAWGSCGKPFPGMEVRISDPDDTGVGIIEVRGPHTLRGICRRSREEVFTVDGFYATGDRGRLDDDGFLFFHGRADDMFKVNGATVYPSEVVDALLTLPGVRAAAATKVSGPQGDQVGALVVCDTEVTLDELRSGARKVLSTFKVPTVWSLTGDAEAIPRGGTGKVDVDRLRLLLAKPHPEN